MADPYASTRTSLMSEIVARLEAGEMLRDICGAPGMPHVETVRNWRRASGAFAADFDRALARGRWRRTWMFDEAKAETLLARYRTGERLRGILADPAMPSVQVFNVWCADQAPFCAEIARLKATHLAERNRSRGRETKVAFDPAAADRIVARVMRGAWLAEVLASDAGLPSYAVLARWRREQPQFDRILRQALKRVNGRRIQARRRREAIEDELAAGIAAGETLRSLAARPGMPRATTFYRWAREDPAFAARLKAAREARRRPQERAMRRRAIMAAARRRMAEVGWKGRRPGPEG